MARMVNIAAAQMGPIAREETRAEVVEHPIAHLKEGARREALARAQAAAKTQAVAEPGAAE